MVREESITMQRVLLVQLVPTVKECFRNLLDLISILLVGASCNPSGAGGALPPLAAHVSSHDQAQTHSSGWSYALTHLDSKQPSAVLTSFQTRSHLKLPNASNRRKWKELDRLIETAIVMGMPIAELRHGKVDDVLRRFTDIV